MDSALATSRSRPLLLSGWLLLLGGLLAGLGLLRPEPGPEPAGIAFAGLWLVVMTLGVYLVAVTGLAAAGAWLRAIGMLQIADRLAGAGFRRLLRVLLGATLVTTMAAPAAAGENPRPPALSAPGDLPQAPPVMSEDPASRQTGGLAPTIPGDEWLVVAGDHCWNIAERVLRAVGQPPATQAVARYWQTLLDANRDRFVDPGNPDLIYPGQRLRLPHVH